MASGRTEADVAIIARIEAARPSAGGMMSVAGFHSWQHDAGSRGIYHSIGTVMASDLVAATRSSGTRLHFAGEHLAQASSGMEAALECGETAARTVIERG